MANFGEGDSLSGYDASGSEVSSLQREQNRTGNRRRWFAHYDTQARISRALNIQSFLISKILMNIFSIPTFVTLQCFFANGCLSIFEY